MRIILCHPYLLTAIQGSVNDQAAQARQPVSEGRGESDSRVAGMRSRRRGCMPWLIPLLQLKTVAEE